jgi:hypothetical protein
MEPVHATCANPSNARFSSLVYEYLYPVLYKYCFHLFISFLEKIHNVLYIVLQTYMDAQIFVNSWCNLLGWSHGFHSNGSVNRLEIELAMYKGIF